jgi:hypothetical protein
MGSGVGIHSHCLVKCKILRTAWFSGYKMNLQATTKQFPTEKVNAGFKHVVPILYLWHIIFLPVPTISIKPELPELPRTCQAMTWIWWGWNSWNGYIIFVLTCPSLPLNWGKSWDDHFAETKLRRVALSSVTSLLLRRNTEVWKMSEKSAVRNTASPDVVWQRVAET